MTVKGGRVVVLYSLPASPCFFSFFLSLDAYEFINTRIYFVRNDDLMVIMNACIAFLPELTASHCNHIFPSTKTQTIRPVDKIVLFFI